jgi:integrase
MLNLGARHEPPKVDRVPYIPMLEENNVKEGFLESEEYLKLLDALPSYLRPMLTFGYRTGWRKEEVSDLTWDRIDLKERMAVKLSGETKNREARAIYLDDQLLKLLRIQQVQTPKDCQHVFSREGEKINDFRFSWNQACREAGLGYGYKLNESYVNRCEQEGLKAGPTFHDLRRTAARNLIRSGVDRDVAKRITGHKTDSIFSRYNIVSANDLKEAAIKQDAFLDGHNNGHNR